MNHFKGFSRSKKMLRLKIFYNRAWINLLLLTLVRFSLGLNCMKGTGALPLGSSITVVSTGDLSPFLYSEGVNIYLSCFIF